MSEKTIQIKKMMKNRLLSMKADAKNRSRFTLYQQVEEIENIFEMLEREILDEKENNRWPDNDGSTAHSGQIQGGMDRTK
tara:strand:- start:441 stop:680 length:240 start_codon:yes stop_codon:yes gene_type:complete